MSKTFALRCWSSNDMYNADFDYALVTVTPELCAQVQRRHAAFKSIEEGRFTVSEIHYHDCTPEYFSESDLSSWMEDLADDAPMDAGAKGLIDGAECVEIPSTFQPREGDDSGDFRSECDRMVVTETGVRWKGVPKHSGITISTAEMAWSDFVEVAAEVAA